MKFVKNSIKILLIIIALNLLYLGGIIIYGSLTDYKPADSVQLPINDIGKNNLTLCDTLTFLSWNIGYCGLGAEMDFFYEGGKMVRPTKKQIGKFTKGVTQFLKQNQNSDFIILQEVDENSSRTKGQNEIEIIRSGMPDFFYSYGDNYKVRFVPMPYVNPLGRVEAGQMSLSKVKPVSSERIAYHSAYSWPKQLFMLDRCFIVSRFNLKNSKQLVLMNTHNSAYDAGGKLKTVEMPAIRDLMVEEFEKGNYVVAGGDWNQNPPDYNLDKVDKTYPPVSGTFMDGNYFPKNWNIVYDPKTPTNREVVVPLQIGKTNSTINDFYILSPNIEALEIKTNQLDFEFSDHNPVFLKVKLIR